MPHPVSCLQALSFSLLGYIIDQQNTAHTRACNANLLFKDIAISLGFSAVTGSNLVAKCLRMRKVCCGRVDKQVGVHCTVWRAVGSFCRFENGPWQRASGPGRRLR